MAVAGLGIVGLDLDARSDQVETAIAWLPRRPRSIRLPGGRHTTPAYTDLANRHDKARLQHRLPQTGQSSVATMPGSDTAVPVPPARASRGASRPAHPETGVGTPLRPYSTRSLRPVRPVPNPFVAPLTPRPRRPAAAAQARREPGTKAYAGGDRLAPERLGRQGASDRGDPQVRRDGIWRAVTEREGRGSANATGDGVQNAWQRRSPCRTPLALAAGQSGQVLMPAGRGVYGRTVLAASSDQGGPVIVEALSGPIAGDRMTGSFERRDERLVVRLNNITLAGRHAAGDRRPGDRPGHHGNLRRLQRRSALCQPVRPSGRRCLRGRAGASLRAVKQSTSVVSPFGGVTSVQHLNLGQQVGVGAGVAGAQLGAILHDAAPKGSDCLHRSKRERRRRIPGAAESPAHASK